MLDYYTIRELYEISNSPNHIERDQIEYVELDGWVRTNRDSGQIGFIELNDGTYFKNAQIVYHDDLDNYNEVSKMLTGTSIKVTGKYIYTRQQTTF